jgi:hypothetical protein
MKRVLSLLMAVVLILGMGTAVSATTTVDRTGVLKSFTDSEAVITVAGEDHTFQYDSKTQVLRIDQEVGFLDAARKGMKVSFKSFGKKLTYINFPNMGAEMQGVARAAKIALSDLRVNVTDSSLVKKSSASIMDEATKEVIQTTVTDFKEIDPITVDEYYYGDPSFVTLGDINILPSTLKVVLNGKEIKVIEGTAEFDKAVTGDEAKYVNTPGSGMELEFEAPITDNKELEQADIEKILKVTYTKKMYEVYTTETNFVPVSNDAVIELNGKPVTLSKAMRLGNYWFATTNPASEVVYVDAFYRDVEALVKSVSSTSLAVDIVRDGEVVGTDTLALSEAVTVIGADGNEISAGQLKANDKIVLTTEPAEGYKVTTVYVK